ncbi:HAD family hydrolase [Bifidobacterium pullorum subsp. saeculare]|uniref:HAD family hydrolase n=1 Tax=Bifidobacterium pullorum subsp. saeculare TaxID=78257 RepID=A0A938WY58_9BIFI|nr:HAD family hydrolase [Bifidobacterium pullorum]MBM6700051.1 HAD family hydrolase [Bifidobacterium pullorum subsp. saeculare]
MLLKAVFWDLDGTLINSEPLWHQGEIEIAHANGGEWTVDDGWEGSGTPVPDVARRMIAKGTRLTVEQIDVQLKDYVYQAEVRGLPWIDGVLGVLRSLKEAGVLSMLVTTSPRRMAENVMAQAGDLLAGYVCGDDPYAHKPDPAPYLAAAARLGVDAADPAAMARCVVLEDSASGIRAGVASGATTIAQTGWIRNDTSGLGQFASIPSYEGIDAAALDAFVRRRVG